MGKVYEEVRAYAETAVTYRGDAFERLVQNLAFYEELRIGEDSYEMAQFQELLDVVSAQWVSGWN